MKYVKLIVFIKSLVIQPDNSVAQYDIKRKERSAEKYLTITENREEP